MMTLRECPPGLFKFDNSYGLKTEYKTETRPGRWQSDAYCVDSGEYFWGGANSHEERERLMVEPMTIDELKCGDPYAGA